MNIFLTGSTGFVGSNLINHLHKNKHTVFALRRKNSNPRIKLVSTPKWINGDLLTDCYDYLNDSELLIHLAAHSANKPYDDLQSCIYWNVYAPIVLFKNAVNSGVKKFMIASSFFEDELFNSFLNNKNNFYQTHQLSTYAISKALSTICLSNFCIENKVNLKILKFPHIYGEGELKTRLWPSLKNAAINGNDFILNNGGDKRPFMYIDDLCISILDQFYIKQEDFHFPKKINFDSKFMSVSDFAKKCWAAFNANGNLIIK